MAVILSFVGKWNGNDLKKAEAEIQRLRREAGQTSSAFEKFGAKAALAGAAVGALAIKMGTDAVQAALGDEAATRKLGKTLENLNLDRRTSEVSDFIDALMMQTGIVDDDLRPAFERLVRSTRDVDEAQRALRISADTAVATGRDLTTVANAIGKAYDGNYIALGRLGTGLENATIKTKNMDLIMSELAMLTDGQAADALDSYSGKMQLVTVATDEAKETVGYAFLKAVDDVAQAMGGEDGYISLIGQAGDKTADLTAGVGLLVEQMVLLGKDGADDGFSLAESLRGVGETLARNVIPQYEEFGDVLEGVLAIGKAQRLADEADQRRIDTTASRWTELGRAIRGTEPAVTGAADDLEDTADAADTAAKKVYTLDDAFKALNNTLTKDDAIASMEAAIDAFAGLDTTKTVGKGKKAREVPVEFLAALNKSGTNFDLREESGRQGFDAAQALILATQQAAQTAGSDADARRILRRGRRQLTNELDDIGFTRDAARAYARDYLTTPSSVRRPSSPGSSIAMTEGAAGVTNVYQFNGDLRVGSVQEAARVAWQSVRLRNLGQGRVTDANIGGGYRR